jgi:hypothetical protein
MLILHVPEKESPPGGGLQVNREVYAQMRQGVTGSASMTSAGQESGSTLRTLAK